MIKKIVVIGPESTGKSTLCAQLADHYNTLWCPEFAREYLQKKGTNYNYDDLLSIAKGQLALEDEYAAKLEAKVPMSLAVETEKDPAVFSADQLLFIDTDMYVMKVWSEFVFGKCHRYILDQVVLRKYDVYLLCDIDLPWTKDDLREYPDIEKRRELFLMYKDIMINQSVPWFIIRGNYEQRFAEGVKIVDEFFHQTS